MTDTTEQPPSPENRQPWLDNIARHPRETAIALAVLTVLLLLIPILLGIKARSSEPDNWSVYLSVCIWGGALALLALGGAIWQFTVASSGPASLDVTRVFVLLMGGMFGFFTTFQGFLLGYLWWDTFVKFVNGEGEQSYRILLVLLAIVGGLGVMFASLQLGRSQERSNPALRVLVYGYNALLTGILLLAILIVVNVLVYLKFPAHADFTASNLYTLSSRSKGIIQALDKPTMIYGLFDTGDPIGIDVTTLLTQCHELNSKIQIKYLSPGFDEEKVRGLATRYGITDRRGVLILYGSDPQIEHRFIKRDDLFSVDRPGFGAPTSQDLGFKFKGEDALITELNALEEGKTKTKIYFTQGNGELDLKSMDAARPDVGAGILKDRLEKRNLEVKPWTFAPDAKPPADADVVVIAGPSLPIADFGLKALRDYMNPAEPGKKKGKLLVFLDVDSTRENKMKQTGLEALLAEFNVQVGNERILNLPVRGGFRNPLMTIVGFNLDLLQQNPIVAAFGRQNFVFYDVRPIRAKPDFGNQPASGRYRAETLLQTVSYAWAETNLREDASKIVNDVLKNKKELQEKLNEPPIPVAVVVSEPAPMNPADPHAMMRSQEGTPRLLVFGDATFVSNQYMSDQVASGFFDLVASCVDLLRERPSSIGIEPKKRNFYALGAGVSTARMILLPGIIAAIAIIGLGAGVWVVRRR